MAEAVGRPVNEVEEAEDFADESYEEDEAEATATGEGDEEKPEKFILAEIILGGLLVLTVDVACIVIDVLSVGVGMFFTPLIQGAVTAGMWMWFRSKGGKQGAGKWALKFLANILPTTPIIITSFTLTIVFALDVYFHNNPKVAALANKAMKTPVR